jgi:hypothetical protein
MCEKGGSSWLGVFGQRGERGASSWSGGDAKQGSVEREGRVALVRRVGAAAGEWREQLEWEGSGGVVDR